MKGAGLVLVAAAGFAILGSCKAKDPTPTTAYVDELRMQNDRLRIRLNKILAADPVVKQFSQIIDPVVVAIRPSVVERVVQEVSFHYLDKVELNLEPHIQVNHTRDIQKKTFLGKVKGGTLMVSIDIRRIKGLMQSKPPTVVFAGANRLNLTAPVRVEKGEGMADFFFKWDSSGLANLICKDFQFTEKLKGTILAASYTVVGAFVLSATPSAIVATPAFAEQKFRMRFDLTPESWARVRSAVESQDTFGKCGVAIDPPAIMEKLKALGQRGFDVKLPKSLVRTINLPASIEQQVNVQDNIVQLAVKPGILSLDKDTLVFSSAVTTSISAMATQPGRPKKPANGPAPVAKKPN